MKHPNREEMMSYLYEELETGPRRVLEQHLETCASCRARLADWQGTVQQLNDYGVAAVPLPRSARPSWLRPALATAAAALVLFAGFTLGRTGGVSRAEVERLQRETEERAFAAGRAEAQRQLQQFAADVGKRLDTLQSQQSSDYASLRKELETVAVLTEAGFRQTENRFVALADSSASTPPAP